MSSELKPEQTYPPFLLEQIRDLNLNRRPKLTFPLPHFPANTYWHGKASGNRALDQTRYGWPRDGGTRKHAAVDLEAPIGTFVLAMADGFILRSAVFYLKTSEITVLHPGIGIIRYGEVDPMSVIYKDRTYIRQGLPIARVGQRTENGRPNPRAMLHLEFFSDETRIYQIDMDMRNSLSQGPKGTRQHPTFQRRSDLEDPTKLMESASLYEDKPLRREGDGWRDTPPFAHFEITEVDLRPLRPLDEATIRMLMLQAQIFVNK